MSRIALATSEVEYNSNTDDALLLNALIQAGIEAELKIWDEPAVDWSQYDLVVIRSIWDYTQKIAAFHGWMEQFERHSQLVNPVSLIRWNYDKRYLIDLANAGVPVVVTHFIPGWTPESVMHCLDQNKLDDIVLKPSISAGGRNTVHLDNPSFEMVEQFLDNCPQQGTLMVQQFEQTIVTDGEISALYIDGKITHCVQKTAVDGEFRVQFTYGGQEAAISIDERYQKFAMQVIDALKVKPFYARIDFIEDDAGDMRLMELELIEPKLFFAHSDDAASRFVDGIQRIIG